MLQTDQNSALKWERYGPLKEDCAKSVATQWCQL